MHISTTLKRNTHDLSLPNKVLKCHSNLAFHFWVSSIVSTLHSRYSLVMSGFSFMVLELPNPEIPFILILLDLLWSSLLQWLLWHHLSEVLFSDFFIYFMDTVPSNSYKYWSSVLLVIPLCMLCILTGKSHSYMVPISICIPNFSPVLQIAHICLQAISTLISHKVLKLQNVRNEFNSFSSTNLLPILHASPQGLTCPSTLLLSPEIWDLVMKSLL